MAGEEAEHKPRTSALDSSFPTLVPAENSLKYSDEKFEVFLRELLVGVARQDDLSESEADMELESDGSEDVVEAMSHAEAPKPDADVAMEDGDMPAKAKSSHPFMNAMLSTPAEQDANAVDSEKTMLTANGDVAFKSAGSALVDLFFEMERSCKGARLRELLDAAWSEDALATLKIIFSGRSIHLGKGERSTFYRCYAWLAKTHPLTALLNLKWLARTVIEKKPEKKVDEEGDAVLIDKREVAAVDGDDEQWEMSFGVSHGYWKDLLNVLVLSAAGSLNVLKDPSDILNVPNKQKKKVPFNSTKEEAKKRRHGLERDRHDHFTKRYERDSFYRALHLSIARVFATRLSADMELLKDGSKASKRRISLAAKWAPSLEGFHDKHTFIASSIAELLFPPSHFSQDLAREAYLRHARASYRNQILSPLRKELSIIERHICANTLPSADYTTVPSHAMKRYLPLFARKDASHFEAYLDSVAAGRTNISGATLNPASLVALVRSDFNPTTTGPQQKRRKISPVERAIHTRTVDAQWRTLVARVRDSGALANCLPVADVSGSMYAPTFPDGTTPLDSSIGLSLLLAEVSCAPFAGAIISFSETPTFIHLKPEGDDGDAPSFHEKVKQMERGMHAGFNTDFVAVFERLILPRAVQHAVRPEDMVKRVFVFSDMHFDQADRRFAAPSSSAPSSSSSLDRVRAAYAKAGYELPELVFWNLAAGAGGGSVAPKPAESTPGVALVGGYGQGLLKAFMEGSGFDEDVESEDEDEAMVVDKVGKGDGEEDVVVVGKEKKGKEAKDSKAWVMTAIGHKAYGMLEVLD